MTKLDDFFGNEEVAAEYSDEKTCAKSDLGYHCRHYGYSLACCICEESKQAVLVQEEGTHD